MLYQFFLMLLLSLALALVLSVCFSGWFTRRILAVRDSLYRFQQGDYGCRIQVKSSDEIGMLADGYNSMADHINRLIHDVFQDVYKRQASSSPRSGRIQVKTPHQPPAAAASPQGEAFSFSLPLEGKGDRLRWMRWKAPPLSLIHIFFRLERSESICCFRAGAQGSLPSFLRKKAGGSGDAAADEVEFRKGAALSLIHI